MKERDLKLRAKESISTTNWLTNGMSKSELKATRAISVIAFEIERKRSSMKMNQKEFAKYMGVTQGMVSKWEGGEYNFTISTLEEICSKLDLELSVNITSPMSVKGTSLEENREGENEATISIPLQRFFGAGEVIAQ